MEPSGARDVTMILQNLENVLTRDVPIRFFPPPTSFNILCLPIPNLDLILSPNIFLDNTAALRKKITASKLFVNSFYFLFC